MTLTVHARLDCCNKELPAVGYGWQNVQEQFVSWYSASHGDVAQ